MLTGPPDTPCGSTDPGAGQHNHPCDIPSHGRCWRLAGSDPAYTFDCDEPEILENQIAAVGQPDPTTWRRIHHRSTARRPRRRCRRQSRCGRCSRCRQRSDIVRSSWASAHPASCDHRLADKNHRRSARSTRGLSRSAASFLGAAGNRRLLFGEAFCCVYDSTDRENN